MTQGRHPLLLTDGHICSCGWLCRRVVGKDDALATPQPSSLHKGLEPDSTTQCRVVWWVLYCSVLCLFVVLHCCVFCLFVCLFVRLFVCLFVRLCCCWGEGSVNLDVHVPRHEVVLLANFVDVKDDNSAVCILGHGGPHVLITWAPTQNKRR